MRVGGGFRMIDPMSHNSRQGSNVLSDTRSNARIPDETRRIAEVDLDRSFSDET